MKKIDIYILKRFLLYYAATLISLLTMLIVMDASGKISRLSREGSFMLNVLQYYLGEIALHLNTLLPMVALMAAIFTVVGLKRNNELVCILSSGISIHRIVFGMFVVLMITVPFFVINSEIVVPYLSKQKTASEKKALVTSMVSDRYISLAAANAIKKMNGSVTAKGFNLTIIEQGTGKLALFLYTPSVTWVEQERKWDFRASEIIIKTPHATEIDPSKLNAVLGTFDSILFPTPERLVISSRSPSSLSVRELRHIMPGRHAVMELFHRFTFPFLMFILVLIALPFSADQDKNINVFIGVGIGLAVVFLSYAFMYFALFLGGKGIIPPWLAGSAPVVVLTVPAILIYKNIKT